MERERFQPHTHTNPNCKIIVIRRALGCRGVVSISDSVSAVAGRPARGSLSGWGVGQGRVPGPLAQPVASWPAVSCGGGGPAPRQALCSAARLGLLPDQPALGLSLGWFSPSLPLCPVPAQPSAASPPAFVLPGILTPRSAIMGSRRMTALPPASCRLAAESPLPQEPVPISCPLALTPVINIGEGSAGSTHNSEAGWVSLSPPLHPPSQTASTTLLGPGVWCPPPTCAGWGGNHAFGRLSVASSLLTQTGSWRGESPL